MNLNIIGHYRPNGCVNGSATRTVADINPTTIITATIYLRYFCTTVGGRLGGPAGGRYWALCNPTQTNAIITLASSFITAGQVFADIGGGGITDTGTGSIPANTPANGNLVEVVTSFDLAGKTKTNQSSINGAALVSGGADSWIGTAPSDWGGGGTPVLYVNQRAGANFSDQVIQAVCYAAGAPTITDFRQWFLGIGNSFFGG